MKSRPIIHLTASLAFAVVLLSAPQSFCEDTVDVTGTWLGSLGFQGVELRIVFNIATDADGALTASMDSPDQGASGIPVSSVMLEGYHLRIEVMSAMGTFEGEVGRDGSTIEGEWRQGGMKLPLVLEKTDEVFELERPQEPKPPFPYFDEEVSFVNENDSVTLTGTLTIPDSKGPFPVALLISGSGSQDRDETVFGHKPFLVLADYLARRGIAVLRFDDRGVGGSSIGSPDATSENFAADVLAGVQFLKSRDEIDPTAIGLIGHSEGGLIAPMVAVQSPDVAFVVMIAGPGLPGESVLYSQAELIFRAEGVGEDVIAAYRKLQRRIFELVKEQPDDSTFQAELDRIKNETREMLTDEIKENPMFSENAIEIQIRSAMTPWFRFFITYDPRPALMKVKCPVLAIIGEKDLQVPAKENLLATEEALKAGGNEDYTIVELPGLNHLLQPARTGSVSEYGKIDVTMSPDAMELMAGWIAGRSK